MSICGIIQDAYDIVHIDHHTAHEGESVGQECLRSSGHVGPHLIKRLNRVGGAYVVWEDDLCDEGECEFCDNEDPVDNCLAFGEVSLETAHELIKNPKFEG